MNRNLYSILAILIFGVLIGSLVAANAQARPASPGDNFSSAPTDTRTQEQRNEPSSPLAAVGTGFSYQGRLVQAGNPVSGQYDFIFKLYDAVTGGNRVGNPITVTNQTVSDGLYTVLLNSASEFGPTAFQGDARWLELAVQPNSCGCYSTLLPRQEFTAAPYASSLMPGAVISGTNATSMLSVYNGSGNGVYGGATTGYGVRGVSTSGQGVRGESNSGAGVNGSSINHNGVEGFSSATAHSGIYGVNTGGGYGVTGSSSTGRGVWGEASSGFGVFGSSASGAGVYGSSNSYWGGYFTTSDDNYDGVYGESSGANGSAGVAGRNNTPGGYAVWGASSGGKAGYFNGNVQVTGSLSKGGGSFKIDDPLDPANKYLSHSFVESPDMMNIYNGEVTLDGKGEATVEMPKWFEALNQDFRYQLTAIGAPGPNLYIAQRIQGNRFKIAGGTQGMAVSWQVTGIRHDPWAQEYRIPVEEAKPVNERGYYLHPELYGQPNTKSVDPHTRNEQPAPITSRPGEK